MGGFRLRIWEPKNKIEPISLNDYIQLKDEKELLNISRVVLLRVPVDFMRFNERVHNPTLYNKANKIKDDTLAFLSVARPTYYVPFSKLQEFENFVVAFINELKENNVQL